MPRALIVVGATLSILVALAAYGGCVRPDASPAEPPATTASDGTTTPAAPSAASIPPADAVAKEARSALMSDHFDVATQARDAVLRGQLELTEAPLLWLGQHGFSKQAPTAWQPHLARMQRAARQASDERTLDACARAIGSMAAECGACHAALGEGPRFEPSDWTELDEPDGQSRSTRGPLQGRMHESVWGMERMWEGLVGPWESAWKQGAQSLRELKDHPGLPARLVPKLAHVRELGSAAFAANGQAARADAYGQLLAACGGCHASMGVDMGATP